MENLEFLNKLKEMKVTFCVSVPHQFGQVTHFAEPQELISFIEDPVKLYADHYGVSKAQYLSWANEEFSVHCAGETSKGKQCKNIVKGGSNIEPRKWVEMQGEYCMVHGEGLDL